MNWVATGIAIFIENLVKISFLGVENYVKFYFNEIYTMHQIVYLMIANICDNIFIFFELSNVHIVKSQLRHQAMMTRRGGSNLQTCSRQQKTHAWKLNQKYGTAAFSSLVMNRKLLGSNGQRPLPFFKSSTAIHTTVALVDLYESTWLHVYTQGLPSVCAAESVFNTFCVFWL